MSAQGDIARAALDELQYVAEELVRTCQHALYGLESMTSDEFAQGADREIRLRLAGALARWHDGRVCEVCATLVTGERCPGCAR